MMPEKDPERENTYIIDKDQEKSNGTILDSLVEIFSF